jgi:hypothetical protein
MQCDEIEEYDGFRSLVLFDYGWSEGFPVGLTSIEQYKMLSNPSRAMNKVFGTRYSTYSIDG